jgi:flagellar secretion chaperone FliS
MYTNIKNAAKTYATTNLESGAIAANPHKLIAMLFEGAMIAILKAENHMVKKEVAAKSLAINKATDIILMGLDASLNMEAGGEIGENLHALYTYMSQQLVLANLHNDQSKLKEVYGLLLDLKNTWDAIAPKPALENHSAFSNHLSSANPSTKYIPVSV